MLKRCLIFYIKGYFEFFLSAIVDAWWWISFFSFFLHFPLSMIVKRRVFRWFGHCGLLPVLDEHFFILHNFFIYDFHIMFCECWGSGFWWSLRLCQSSSSGVCCCFTGTWAVRDVDIGVGIGVGVTWGDLCVGVGVDMTWGDLCVGISVGITWGDLGCSLKPLFCLGFSYQLV